MRVLIIDGNSELLDVYRAIFEEAKVDVCTCYSVCDSRKNFFEQQNKGLSYDLVLTDLNVNTCLDGLEFVREIKMLASETVFIFISYADYLKKQVIEEFGDCYMNKQDFIDLLSEQLSSSQPIGMDCFQSFFKRKPRLVFD